jgi:hypothetical protein
VVEFDMEEGISISIQPKPTFVPVVVAPSLLIAPVDPRVDVRVEVIEVMVMEE